MKYHKSVLANNLRLLTVPMPQSDSATITIWIRTGSRFEQKNINGISHFLEHMVFKGTPKRPSTQSVALAVDSFGGEFNAATSKEWTNFYIKAAKDKLDAAFDVLSDIVLNPLLRSEDIERERGVILAEIDLYEDTPARQIWDLFENVIYSGNSLGWDVIGTKKTVKTMQRNHFLDYRQSHYYPENMLITVAGGITESQVLALAKKYLSILKKTDQKPAKPKVRFKQKSPKLFIKTKKTDQAHLIMGFRSAKLGHLSRYSESVAAALLGQGMSSRMFLEVREKRGLAYSVRTFSDHSMDNGYVATYAGVQTKGVEEAIRVMLEQYYGMSKAKLPISHKEMAKAKEYVKGHLALFLEDTRAVSEFFGLEELLLGNSRTPDEVYAKIDKVKLEEVYAVAREFFKPERLNLAIIGPYNNQDHFKKLLL
jgi:predicted Zn-dependent peptidase